jgi:chromosome segregation ATPase
MLFDLTHADVLNAQVALWWRYTTSIVRRQAIAGQKQALASQLENLVKVSTETVQNLEREKQKLTEERQALSDQVLALQQQSAHLESQLADARAKLSERDGELADRNALRGEIQKLQQALKGSLELITAQQNATIAQAAAGAASSGTVDASAFQMLQQQAQAQQAELSKLRAELQQAQMNAERGRLAEVALKSEVETLTRTSAQLRTELSMAQSASAFPAVSDISTAQVQSHVEYKRLEALLSASQYENERLKQVETQLRQQLAQALGQA